MTQVTRRALLQGMACSAAAHPLTSTMTFAAAPGEARLVVIVLRGGLDGMGLLPPVGDPGYAALRPSLSQLKTLELDGFYGLNTGFDALHPLWKAGELGFVNAVSTPYRDKRSHFDGQDLLEAGTGMDVSLRAQRDGWLNRFLQTLPDAAAETAYAVGREEMRILRGEAPTFQWAPDTDVEITPQARLLLEYIYEPDPLFAATAGEALELAQNLPETAAETLQNGLKAEPLAAFTAQRLQEEARIASYSLSGWDTHRGQKTGLSRALDRLQRSILTLREGLGPVWDRTAVLAVTEFGRTVRENGSKGTDHGTAGVMIYAGGAVRGGQVLGGWPGLDEASLYARRDLMPLDDVRRYAAWTMRGLFGTNRAALEGTVFPGLDLGDAPGIVA